MKEINNSLEQCINYIQHIKEYASKLSIITFGRLNTFHIFNVVCVLTLTVSSVRNLSIDSLKKLEIELPCDPAIPLLGIHTEETRRERHMYPNVHHSTVYNSQDMEAT